MKRLYWTILVLFALASCSVSRPVTIEAPAERGLPPGLFERIAVIGASGSAGFNLQLETGAPVRLADFLDQALLVPHNVIYDGATEMLFMAPEKIGTRIADEAMAADPSLLIAPDFLFWFFYGKGETAVKRRERLEQGLSLLEGFDCQIVIGELPDMRAAAGGMIPFLAMPPAESFAGANERLHAWARSRGSVVVLPLVQMNAALLAGESLVGNFSWDADQLGSLLQADRLHPNMAGAALLSLEILHGLASLNGSRLSGIALTNIEQLVDAVDDLVSSR